MKGMSWISVIGDLRSCVGPVSHQGPFAFGNAPVERCSAGYCVYDGPLLNGLGSANVDDCVKSTAGLRGMPIETAHAGHDPSFGWQILLGLID